MKYRYRRWALPGTGTWYKREASGLPNVAVEVHSDSPVMMRHLEALAMGRGTMVTAGSVTIRAGVAPISSKDEAPPGWTTAVRPGGLRRLGAVRRTGLRS